MHWEHNITQHTAIIAHSMLAQSFNSRTKHVSLDATPLNVACAVVAFNICIPITLTSLVENISAVLIHIVQSFIETRQLRRYRFMINKF